MKNFRCRCGNTVYFENTLCLACGATLGYLPELGELVALDEEAPGTWRAPTPNGPQHYRKCINYAREHVCNWMVAADDPQPLCRSCRLSQVIPNLSAAPNRERWYRIEAAKRRLLHTLHALRLPVVGRDEDPATGLSFQFLEDRSGAEFSDEVGEQPVLTGHANGVITLNLAEADPSSREAMREQMNERYRTLIGHFRHEIGHYYWQRLVWNTSWLAPYRALFGDERAPYQEALRRHYEQGPPVDWAERYISAYASAHPWEDWAETWAHYLHIVDGLDTAFHCGFALHGEPVPPPPTPDTPAQDDFDVLLARWEQLAAALNALNRSMGLEDAYPFALTGPVKTKLRFVHELISATAS
ncbi:putative zinc-binding peptidase [Ectothiorhodospiraceae bacterium 2226]|nr:putative zinc-binding peptidase [Ectothiorhodospiraceae bacterium 2226]